MTRLVRKLSDEQHSQFPFSSDLIKNSDQPPKTYIKVFIGDDGSSVVQNKKYFTSISDLKSQELIDIYPNPTSTSNNTKIYILLFNNSLIS